MYCLGVPLSKYSTEMKLASSLTVVPVELVRGCGNCVYLFTLPYRIGISTLLRELGLLFDLFDLFCLRSQWMGMFVKAKGEVVTHVVEVPNVAALTYRGRNVSDVYC